MKLSTRLAGENFTFRSVKEVLAKANEEEVRGYPGGYFRGIRLGADRSKGGAQQASRPGSAGKPGGALRR